MALIVEDGTIVAGANTYATAADVKAYSLARGTDLSATSDATVETWLVKAMDYLAGRDYQGTKVRSDQPLDWPRYGAYIENFPIASDTIPRQLLHAQIALALEAQTTDLLPTVTPGSVRGPVTSERVEGAVSVTYANPGRVLTVSSFAKADALLRVLLARNGLVAVRT